MKSRDFCYWLQGYFELASAQGLTKEQVDTIKAHLSMVFIHEIDPSFPQHQQQSLNEAHNVGNATLGQLYSSKPNKPSWGDEPQMKC